MSGEDQSIYKSFYLFLGKRKYELLLLGLIQHLFVGIFVLDFQFYVRILWPVNMVILAILASGLFLETEHWINRFKMPLFVAVILFPIGLPFFGEIDGYFVALSLTYVLFYLVLLVQVFRYMIRPSYINIDLITAAICGFLLMIEVFVFVAYMLVHLDPGSFANVDLSNPPSTFTDLVYFSSVTLTTIGYGDISPVTHQAKLISSFFGITGQFYQVLLVGVLISKFTSRKNS
ncbi:potassium channel family protein [Gracilimonas tropica]|uniref:potassium channel family protein n=1 Tax=Gracilimonas tropica TaxID=454600 RepID=UPI00035D26ED|nr:potassium channel family protein [Gracilimonas tropica]